MLMPVISSRTAITAIASAATATTPDDQTARSSLIDCIAIGSTQTDAIR